MNFGQKIKLILLVILISSTTSHISQAEVINKILAYVGDRIITSYDIQNLDPEQYKKLLAIEDNETRASSIKAFTDQVLDFLVNQNLIEIAAAREGIKVSDAEVDLAIEDIIKRNNLTKEQLVESLAKENLTMIKYRYQLKNEILNVRVRNAILIPKLIVVDNDIKKVIDDNPSEYNLTDKYEVKMILTSDKPAINKAIKEIKSGKSFDDVAKAHSIDLSAGNGGYMGFMDIELVNDDMKKVLKTGQVGKLSDIFSFNGQYGVFYIISYKNKYDFDEETREKLTQKALEKMFEKNFNTWLDRNKATIVVMRNDLPNDNKSANIDNKTK